MDIIASLKDKTSTGFDKISNKILKIARNILSLLLSDIFKLCFLKGQFPNECKIAKVIPLYKEGARDNCENYRPISILCSISKIFEKMISSRMMSYFEQYDILSADQYGFRSKRPTVDAISLVVTEIQNFLKIDRKRQFVILILKKYLTP